MVDKIFNPLTQKGQLLERMIFVESNGISLDAIYLRGSYSEGVVVAPSIFHGVGAMDSAVANEIAYAFARKGLANIRFSWRGQRGSQGKMIQQGEDQSPLIQDLTTTINYLKESANCTKITVVGLYDSANVVLKCVKNMESVSRVILVHPSEETIIQEEKPVFAFFAGEEPLPNCFRTSSTYFIKKIPDADYAFRRNLSLLGEKIPALVDSVVDKNRL